MYLSHYFEENLDRVDVDEWLRNNEDPNVSRSLLGQTLFTGTKEDVNKLLDVGAKITEFEFKHLFPYTVWHQRAARTLFLSYPDFHINPNTLYYVFDGHSSIPEELDVIEELIERGADVNYQYVDENGKSMSILAQLFFSSNYRIRFHDETEQEHQVRCANFDKLVDFLLRHGAVYKNDYYFDIHFHLNGAIELNLSAVFRLFKPMISEKGLQRMIEYFEQLMKNTFPPKSVNSYPLLRELVPRKYVRDIRESCERNKDDGGDGRFYAKRYRQQTTKYIDPVTLDDLDEVDDSVVILPSGHCINRSVLQTWFNGGSFRDPTTNQQIPLLWRLEWGFD